MEFFEQDISKSIFKKKYMLHGEKNVEQVFREIAEEISSVEKDKNFWKNRFYDKMISHKFIPGGRILANARPYSKLKNYLNCFVIDIEDSMEGITNTLSEYMHILRKGGGVGLNISKLRPKGSVINTGGNSSGPLSFLEIFDQASKTIEVGGHRRGASICIMNIDHPDIEEFISFKRGDENKKLTQFNISVGITKEFINALKNNEMWDLKFNGITYKQIKACFLYDKIIENSLKYNEPGIFNLSAVNKYNNGFYMYDIQAPNACGELPMPPYSVCALSSINLSSLVDYPFEDKASFNWDEFQSAIKVGIRFLDNALDKTEYPLDKIRERSLGDRRIGLGITGLGDMFAMLKITYGDEESFEFAQKLFSNLRNTSYLESINLAKEKGHFPNFDLKILDSSFIKTLPKGIREDIKKYGLRNIALNTIAPVGTGSFTVGNNCSSGIEPIFSLEYNRSIRNKNGDIETEKVKDLSWLKYKQWFENNSKDAEWLLSHYDRTDPNTNKLKVPNYFITSLNIRPYEHINMQAIAQQYIDNGISKTINLPEDYSKEKYKNLFLYGFNKELKGLTTYRLNSMKGILELDSNDNKRPQYIIRQDSPKRPKELPCDIHEISVDKEKHIVLVGKLQGTLYEIFVTNDPKNKIDAINSKEGIIRKVRKGQYQLIVENGEEKVVIDNIGQEFDSTYASLSRFISMGLRHGVSLQFIITQLQKDKNFVGFEKSVARILKKYIKSGEKVETSEKCSECGGSLIYEEGCKKCAECGNSKCE